MASPGFQDAQEQIDTRAFETAIEAKAGVGHLAEVVRLRFDSMQAWMQRGDDDRKELRTLVLAKHDETIGAIHTLRKDESVKRGAIYRLAWGIAWTVILGLLGCVVALLVYIWQHGIH